MLFLSEDFEDSFLEAESVVCDLDFADFSELHLQVIFFLLKN